MLSVFETGGIYLFSVFIDDGSFTKSVFDDSDILPIGISFVALLQRVCPAIVRASFSVSILVLL
jgi:hypothetical protein